ncbi:S-layer family protein [Leptolyngbya sp. FACHB-261]|uniref:beta strand repeat-containing protein n=1 Tax=Leptolyngbya sp. FACHB-261 TaxID=2692806 RepID=UPI00168392C9|nr:S-layer family protein [Leptolyngbya sp. FACHB-261]MBD2104092.1 S-layer family protein [Leptolyngbya sp. FACHB-261]
MNQWYLSAWFLTGSTLSALLCAQSIAAQVVPDSTLSARERSQVSGNPNFQIDGGARRGGNLFHSFQQFSVSTGGSAYFNNAADVQNIFSRVTGRAISNIDGLIRANGTANLFLLNPNGILFGPNASLNIGGSFMASTANSINFADNFQYSATNPQSVPLLTISVPIGLQFGQNSKGIRVVGEGHSLTAQDPVFAPLIRGTTQGLQVPSGKTLALVGGDVALEGGTLMAEGGRIELGSVEQGYVSLSSAPFGWILDYRNVPSFKDIQLFQGSLVDASGMPPGSIFLQGNYISLRDGSVILLQNQSSQSGGEIRVNASESLEVSGTTPNARITSNLISQTLGNGNGGGITISAERVAVRDGGQIMANTFSSGNGGDLTLDASQSVRLIGVSPVNPLATSNIAAVTYNSGNAGNVTVSTRQLTILNGGVFVSTSFGPSGTGNSGNVTVNASEIVEVSGVEPIFRQPSILSAGAGNAGAGASLTINTSRLVVRSGGSVNTATLADGRAGNLIVNASSVEVSGQVRGSLNRLSSIGSFARLTDVILQQLFGLPPVPTGGSGDVTINTGRLSVTDGAVIDVRNDGPGNGGTLRVNVNSIVLESQGSITAETISGEGGNINLNVRDLLLLRNNSQITASASGSGNGGNITINTSSLVAIPNENSDIRANSVNARGGNVITSVAGMFGIQFRSQGTALSDITATGANSALNGTVQLNVEATNPTSGLVELPTAVVDVSRLVAQGCPANQGNSFTITGRGGLPPTPEQQLDDNAEWQDRRRLTVAQQTNPAREVRSQRLDGSTQTLHPASDRPITEATGWQVSPTGGCYYP